MEIGGVDNNEYLVVDNALSALDFNQLKRNLYDTSFPWNFVPTAYGNLSTHTEEEFGHCSFAYSPAKYDGANGVEVRSYLEKILGKVMSSAGVSYERIDRIRVCLLPQEETSKITEPHIDTHTDHTVGILYLTTSSAPTILYTQHKDKCPVQAQLNYFRGIGYINQIRSDFEIQDTIASVENRILLFNGSQYHSASTPTDVKRRIAINWNFI